jgi:hypothetical protein
MSRRRRTFVLGSTSVAIVACAASVILISRASTSPASSTRQQVSRAPQKRRNLALQPEAAALNRRLGNRFKSESAGSVLTGNLTLGANQLPVTIIRRQSESGEMVELLLKGRSLTWSEEDGVKETQSAATAAEHLLVERLVSDSPDQFVLAQLRGASYQTIFRNLRPNDAGDDYAGPLWTMVRVNDPQTKADLAPKSPWRLYFINSKTGLIDRVECDLDGQRIEATMLQWIDQSGERLPSHIRWTSNGQTLMEFQLTSFLQG